MMISTESSSHSRCFFSYYFFRSSYSLILLFKTYPMTVSKVSSVQFVFIYLMAALRIEFYTSSVKRLRKESSEVDIFCIELMLVMLLS